MSGGKEKGPPVFRKPSGLPTFKAHELTVDRREKSCATTSSCCWTWTEQLRTCGAPPLVGLRPSARLAGLCVVGTIRRATCIVQAPNFRRFCFVTLMRVCNNAPHSPNAPYCVKTPDRASARNCVTNALFLSTTAPSNGTIKMASTCAPSLHANWVRHVCARELVPTYKHIQSLRLCRRTHG